jgi:hypothetical protein
LDENQAEFYGQRYERSLIRFYQSFLHYKLASENVDKKFHLGAAKNVLQEWDSIFNQYKLEVGSRSLYRSDLMENLWGGLIHEQIESPSDRQTALILYRRAKELLSSDYSIYPTFNSNYEQVDNIQPTQHMQDLITYIDRKIAQLNDRSAVDNLVVVVKDGLISEKKIRNHSINLKQSDIWNASYISSILSTPANSSHNIDQNAFAIFLSVILLKDDLAYYTSYIDFKDTTQVMATVTGDNDFSVAFPLAVAEPLSDIAVVDINHKNTVENAKLVARMTAEYVTAAVTAYLTYREILKRSENSLSALLVALPIFKALCKGIRAHNRPDLRQWRLLPSNIHLGTAYLPPGTYTLNISKDNKSAYTSKLIVSDQRIMVDVNMP